MIFRPSEAFHLPVAQVGQRDNGECLVACTTMVCAYLGIPTNYQRPVKVLRVQRGLGTPFHQIHKLETIKISVIYREQGTLKELYDPLDSGWPCIVGVHTKELPHWRGIGGMAPDYIYLNDPEFPDSPIRVPRGDFDLAWLEQKEVYAVLVPANR